LERQKDYSKFFKNSPPDVNMIPDRNPIGSTVRVNNISQLNISQDEIDKDDISQQINHLNP
jgi:hypothetical protein